RTSALALRCESSQPIPTLCPPPPRAAEIYTPSSGGPKRKECDTARRFDRPPRLAHCSPVSLLCCRPDWQNHPPPRARRPANDKMKFHSARGAPGNETSLSG